MLKKILEAVSVIAQTPRVATLVWKAHPGLTLALVFLTFFSGLIPLAMLWISKLLIDVLIPLSSQIVTDPGEKPGRTVVLPFIILVPVIGVIGLRTAIRLVADCISPTLTYIQQQLSDFLVRDVNRAILKKANSLPDISVFETPSFYDLLSRAQSAASYRPVQMVRDLSSLLKNLIGALFIVALLVSVEPWLAIAVIVLSLPQLALQVWHQREGWSVQDFDIAEVRRMRYYTSILTSDYHAKEVRLFGLGDLFLDRYTRTFDDFHERHGKIRFRQWLWNIGAAGFAATGAGVVSAAIILKALTGNMTIGDMTMYLGALAQLEGYVSELIWSISLLYEGNLFAADFFAFLKVESPIKPSPISVKTPSSEMECRVEFENVTFKYPGSENEVLSNLNLTIEAGQTVALVGENGAGKTTIVKLLTRLHDPDSGRILIGGRDVRDIDIDRWREQIGVVFQDFSRYHMTARENIGLGRATLIDELSVVKAAAEKGGAAAVIRRLPAGYETMLGKWFVHKDEEGAELSGGEWQKIALSRAFMRSRYSPDNPTTIDDFENQDRAPDAKLLILDEPTSSLDVQSEYDVYLRFHELTAGKTTLLISHRFSTVRMADHIIVLDKGAIIERGSHQELMEKDGTYARLYKLQADRYT